MKQLIADTIAAFVREYSMRPGIATRWGTPNVGFCNTKSSAVQELKHSVARDHLLPQT